MIGSYKTLEKYGCAEYITKKSRFIGHAIPCTNEEEAKAFISRIKAEHREATHNCSAYIVGIDSGIMRYSDDGEPSGTAGIPMLETIKSMGLVNCVVVVTRYFGGILLGAGGLIRAYRKTATLGLKAANPVIMQNTYRLNVKMNYSLWSRFENKVSELNVILEDVSYTAEVELKMLVLQSDLDNIKQTIVNFCDANVDISHNECFYYPWHISESDTNE